MYARHPVWSMRWHDETELERCHYSGRGSMEAGSTSSIPTPYLGEDKLVWAQIKEAGSFQTELQYPPARSRPQPPPLRRSEEPRAQSFRPGAPLNVIRRQTFVDPVLKDLALLRKQPPGAVGASSPPFFVY